MSFKQRRKPVAYWTKERVINGLRRYARDLFAGREKHLPKRYSTYLDAIPEDVRRLNRQLRLYPPPARVLLHYRSVIEAWEDLGFALEYRHFENWTRDEAIRGLKRVYAAVGYCPTAFRKYCEIVSGQISDTKYPSLLTILDLFRSVENAWLSAGFTVDLPKAPLTPGDGRFIAELLEVEGIEFSDLRETGAIAEIVKLTFLERAIGIIAVRIERLKREAEQAELSAAKTAFEKAASKKAALKSKPGKIVKKIHFDKDGQAFCRQNSKTNRFNLELTIDKAAVTCSSCLDILGGRIVLCRFPTREELPERAFCQQCETEKPIKEMMVAFLKSEKLYRVRPRCKECYNERERGHRREWKREYQQNWRKDNSELNDSYWKDNPKVKEQSRQRTNKIWNEKREAVLIQGRMNRHGRRVSLKKAEELLTKFGRCYPTGFGLTTEGERECEKIRSRFRLRKEKPPKPFDIRLMVYADDNANYRFVIRPEEQPEPYKQASVRLKQWHDEQKLNNRQS